MCACRGNSDLRFRNRSVNHHLIRITERQVEADADVKSGNDYRYHHKSACSVFPAAAFLFKPIQKIMDQRDELIRGQLKDAQDQKESAGKLKAQYEEALASAKEESGQIVERAKTEAVLQADAIVKNANEEAGPDCG